MTERIYEGSWEEIAEHAPEFSGRRVKLIVLSEEPEFQGKPAIQIWSDLLDEADRLKPSKPVSPTDPHEVIFGEAVAEKYRKQGFDL